MIAGDAALLTAEQMRAADRFATAAGIAGIALMEAAGRAVADSATRLAKPEGTGPIAILCGPGNNGGDGFVAGRVLRERGFTVEIGMLGGPEALKGDAAEAFRRWNAPVRSLAETAIATPPCLFIDALFGAGLTQAVAGEAAVAIERMNGSGLPILAVDVPSGLDADTGGAHGPVVRASETVTFFRLKPGHLLLPGRALCGMVTLAEIGIPAEVLDQLDPQTWRNAPELWRSSWPAHDAGTHKFSRGAVAVLAGGVAGVGAPRLGGRAALRIGAGLVTIHCAPSALLAHASRGPDAVMQRPLADADALADVLSDRRLGAVLAGPALGLDARAEGLLEMLTDANLATVLDADALTLIARKELLPFADRGRPLVMTPHEGEFQRLFGAMPEVVSLPSKLERARAAARRSGAVLVYKGADSVIAAPDGRAAINTTGSAALATAGSGDVLGGMIAGLLAQGMPAFEAAAAAVWLHGRAGEEIGFGLIADDLPEVLPHLMRGLPAG